jgi:hypothetical protein
MEKIETSTRLVSVWAVNKAKTSSGDDASRIRAATIGDIEY